MSTREGKILLSMLDKVSGDYLDVSPPKGVPVLLWRSWLSLVRNYGIGKERSGRIYIGSSGRVRTAVLAAQLTRDVGAISQRLSWKDFELFVSEIAEQCNYVVRSNVNLSKPRTQIDVVAVKGSLAIAIDCKHWNKTAGESSLTDVARKQIKRAKILLRSKQARESGVKIALPCIVTLVGGSSKSSAGVPVVPISGINSFFANVDGLLDEYRVITRQ